MDFISDYLKEAFILAEKNEIPLTYFEVKLKILSVIYIHHIFLKSMLLCFALIIFIKRKWILLF